VFSISEISNWLLLIDSLVFFFLGFVTTPFIIRQMVKRDTEFTGLLYPFTVSSIMFGVSMLILFPLNLVIYSAFPTYIGPWPSLRNIAIQWFFRILLNMFSVLLYTILFIYLFDLRFKRAIFISIFLYVIEQLTYAFLSRISSTVFSMLLTGSRSYGPI
jgi:hypothetical protein